MSYYEKHTTQNLITFASNLSAPRTFTGECAGAWDAFQGRNAEDRRHFQMVTDELSLRGLTFENGNVHGHENNRHKVYLARKEADKIRYGF